jgi:hypothetical protein
LRLTDYCIFFQATGRRLPGLLSARALSRVPALTAATTTVAAAAAAATATAAAAAAAAGNSSNLHATYHVYSLSINSWT